jgi:hypothetical protein
MLYVGVEELVQEQNSNGFASYLWVQCGKCNNTQESYIVSRAPVELVPTDQLPRSIIFHNGFLVRLPMSLIMMLVVLWFLVSFTLACLRIAVGVPLSMLLMYYASWSTVRRRRAGRGCCSRACTACC